MTDSHGAGRPLGPCFRPRPAANRLDSTTARESPALHRPMKRRLDRNVHWHGNKHLTASWRTRNRNIGPFYDARTHGFGEAVGGHCDSIVAIVALGNCIRQIGKRYRVASVGLTRQSCRICKNHVSPPRERGRADGGSDAPGALPDRFHERPRLGRSSRALLCFYRPKWIRRVIRAGGGQKDGDVDGARRSGSARAPNVEASGRGVRGIRLAPASQRGNRRGPGDRPRRSVTS